MYIYIYTSIIHIHTLLSLEGWFQVFPVPSFAPGAPSPKDTRERRGAVLQIFEGLLIDLAAVAQSRPMEDDGRSVCWKLFNCWNLAIWKIEKKNSTTNGPH